MLASDLKNTVLSKGSKDGWQGVDYTAYGYSTSGDTLGYNGERREAQTGWYLLGNGYRAYNPILLKFNSPDSKSPFDEGWVNAYAYTEGDPVNNSDPTGHSPWLWAAAKSAGGKPAAVGRTAQLPKPPSAYPASGDSSRPALPTPHPDYEGAPPPRPRRQQVSFGPVTEYYPSVPDVTGPKFGDSLSNPKPGIERLRSRLNKSLHQPGVVASHKSPVPEPPTMFQSDMEQVRSGSGWRSQNQEAADSQKKLFV